MTALWPVGFLSRIINLEFDIKPQLLQRKKETPWCSRHLKTEHAWLRWLLIYIVIGISIAGSVLERAKILLICILLCIHLHFSPVQNQMQLISATLLQWEVGSTFCAWVDGVQSRDWNNPKPLPSWVGHARRLERETQTWNKKQESEVYHVQVLSFWSSNWKVSKTGELGKRKRGWDWLKGGQELCLVHDLYVRDLGKHQVWSSVLLGRSYRMLYLGKYREEVRKKVAMNLVM